MRNLTATLCLAIVVFLGSVGVSDTADYQKGLTAAQRGDFATGLREWTPLALWGGVNQTLIPLKLARWAIRRQHL